MGVDTSREILSENGISGFEYFEEWRETTRALSQQRLGNAYAEEYTLALETSLTSTEGLSAALSSASIKTTSWALGGQVQGKKIHNKYPESVAPDNKQDQGRGRMIPLYPWESMMVRVAQWMGITATADLQDVFPNFANFNSTLLNTDEANKILQTR